jgi:hypothetical protein
MKKINFDSILPEESSQDYVNVKLELPHSVLIEYAEAINKKYTNKLKAFVTESSRIKTNKSNFDEYQENLAYAFSFEAAIGQGYLYRLIEVEQTGTSTYPVKVKVFRDHTSHLGTYKDYNSFYTAIVGFLDSGIVKTIILNLLAQVELYNESRNQRFEE